MKRLAIAATALAFTTTVAGAASFDTISEFAPADILPPALLKGADHQVLAPAHLDGVIFDYDVKTPQGTCA